MDSGVAPNRLKQKERLRSHEDGIQASHQKYRLIETNYKMHSRISFEIIKTKKEAYAVLSIAVRCHRLRKGRPSGQNSSKHENSCSELGGPYWHQNLISYLSNGRNRPMVSKSRKSLNWDIFTSQPRRWPPTWRKEKNNEEKRKARKARRGDLFWSFRHLESRLRNIKIFARWQVGHTCMQDVRVPLINATRGRFKKSSTTQACITWIWENIKRCQQD